MKLKTKLALAFAVIALVATLLASGMVTLAVKNAFQTYVSSHQNMRLKQWVTVFSGYYSENQTWAGAQSLVAAGRGRGRGAQVHRGSGPVAARERVLLADPSGSVVVDSYGDKLGARLSPQEITRGTEIKVNGKTVGTLLVSVEPPTGLVTMEDIFSSSVNRSVIWSSLLAIALAAALGIFFADKLSRPIKLLTAAARSLAKGDLEQKVAVPGSDELADLAETFNSMAESLAETEQLRQTLVADVAHELRTPLAVLRGNLESLLAGVTKPSEETLASLHDEVLRMTYLVRDLQELSLADAGQLHLNLENEDIIKLTSDVVSALEFEATAKHLDIKTDFPTKSLPVTVDSKRIKQVLFNLVGNAVRYTPDGGKINVRVTETNGSVEISIADTGPGIPEKDLPYIFERFYRSDKARTRSTGGTGLGLAIAKGFVEAHGGTITAANQPQGGSVFTVILPKQPINQG